MSNIRLIVGLGNPGREYDNTRHNAGFWFIDLVAQKYNVSLNLESKFFGYVGKFKHNQILVAHDELDFEPGVIKLKLGGGAAGHNGLKDTSRVLGNDYWRLRIGIGHPGDRNKVVDFVLKKPTLDERIEIDRSLDKAISILEQFLSGEQNSALKQLHTK